MDIREVIRTVPDWPKEGIMFRDITTLLLHPEAFKHTIDKLVEHYKDKGITHIAGIESRGFIFGSVLAKELSLPFVIIRKPGKLPADVVSQEYELEYGTDKIEMHRDAIKEGDQVLIVDDLIATAGTLKAAISLVEKVGGKVISCAVIIELSDLKGRELVGDYDLYSLVQYDGE